MTDLIQAFNSLILVSPYCLEETNWGVVFINVTLYSFCGPSIVCYNTAKASRRVHSFFKAVYDILENSHTKEARLHVLISDMQYLIVLIIYFEKGLIFYNVPFQETIKPHDDITRTIQRSRRRGRLSRGRPAEAANTCYTWNKIKSLAMNKSDWEEFVEVLSSF